MKGNTLLKATAGLGLAAGIVAGGATVAQAASPGEGDAADQVLRHARALKASARPKPRPAVARDKADKERPWWLLPASFPAAKGDAGDAPRVTSAQADGQRQAREAAAPAQPEKPGVLTREGVLVIEPSIEYQHTDINRFVVGGVAILDTVLVGSIEATQANRDAVTGTLGFRYGITNRIEAELRVPYMYRNDQTTNTVVNTNNTAAVTSLTDHGLGDIEGAVHWQVNDGEGANVPFVVANLRVKSTTGRGPFDTKRDAAGIEQELATGSGFWGIEPSVTLIAPSDPAVFYANLGYLWNISRDVDKQVSNNQHVGRVDPGDAIRFGVGMGLSLNERVSFSVGYTHDFIMGTRTHFDTGSFKSESLSVGSMSFGVNWQMTPDTALNVTIGIGVTSDAPDMRLMARLPIALKVF